MKKIILFLFALTTGCLQMNAQFSYSVKIGYSWANIRNWEGLIKENPGCTFGVNVDYAFNSSIGLQSGLNYRYISEDEESYPNKEGIKATLVNNHASFLEVPLLVTAYLVKSSPTVHVIVGAGPYLDVPIAQKSFDDEYDFRTYYGIIATAQLELYAHYFVKGEYQWALSSDRKYMTDRRTNILSLAIGYKF